MVHKPLLEQISCTVSELQVFIQHMAGMIEERRTYFQVDPDDTLLKVLGGAETTSQLHAAWLSLTSQLSVAQKFMLKYQQEYQNNSVPSSPVSTNPDVHQYIAGLPDIDDKLRSIHGAIPRHAEKLPRKARQQITETKEKWEQVIPTPPWLASSPITDVPARTSYKAASSFTLPDIVEPTETVQKRQISTVLTPWKESRVVQFTPQTNTTESPLPLAPMSSGTPFKSSKGLFSQGEGQDLGPFPQTGPNRHTSASNFLYGTDEIPAFSPDGMQFSGFSFPSNRMTTPSAPPMAPVTSTPWNRGQGEVQSFHSMFSQKQDDITSLQDQGALQVRTQVTTLHVNTGSTNNGQRVERTTQNQTATNARGSHDHNPNEDQPGDPGGGGSDPPDDDPPRNPRRRDSPRNDHRRVSRHQSGSRRGRGGGPTDPPSSSSHSSRTSSRTST